MPGTNQEEQFEKLIAHLSESDKLDMAAALRIASYMRDEIRTLNLGVKEELAEVRNEMRNTNVTNLRRIIALEGAMDSLKTTTLQARMIRADKEVQEAEQRLQIAREIKDGLNTQEKIEVKAAISEQLTQDRQKQNQEVASVWRKRWDSVVTAIMVTLGISAATGFVAFLAWLINLYMQNR